MECNRNNSWTMDRQSMNNWWISDGKSMDYRQTIDEQSIAAQLIDNRWTIDVRLTEISGELLILFTRGQIQLIDKGLYQCDTLKKSIVLPFWTVYTFKNILSKFQGRISNTARMAAFYRATAYGVRCATFKGLLNLNPCDVHGQKLECYLQVKKRMETWCRNLKNQTKRFRRKK